jgi:hypothetical protein
MVGRLLPLVMLGLFSGCCCWGSNSDQCKAWKPPLNCLGNAYDGSSNGCYRPPGPFWCCLPGPCSTCRDPWLRYYQERNADWIGRPVVGVDSGGNAMVDDADDDDEYMTTRSDSVAPRVIHQAKLEE